ncbi:MULTISPECIES: hypothetical protein [unclassified Streptomyces]|uniref:hypothetical protein n=1 Tax=unclassified Streptomyces TaxID=2593676 RepID=UPI002366D860|nr:MULTISPECIES: hypothetical protein [unclassified Streptomyces]MDF3141783.1 hypothetical protein [Streptomyces sp. T21Q-yed]WDF36442.1 hypothetical protein PBV52_06475 [Streptomyces sp. T12]
MPFPTSAPTPQTLKRQLGGYVRRGNDEAAEKTRRELKAAVLARHIQEFVSTAPLPTSDQLARLRALLGGGRDAA